MSLTLIIEVVCQHFCNLSAGNVDYVCKIIERLSPSSLFKITLPLFPPSLHWLLQCGIMHCIHVYANFPRCLYFRQLTLGEVMRRLEFAQKNKYIIYIFFLINKVI